VSSEAAAAFAERLKTDESFQTTLAAAPDPAARLAIAREEGFDLGRDDVAAVKKALAIGELSDEDLERVAGGIGTTTSVATSAVTVSVGAAAAFL
jgi:predicted ribosomally synthesized peptide with nif11-like leader